MGASFHVDLYEVKEVTDEDGTHHEAVNPEYCMLEELYSLSGIYKPFETITLNGKTYVLCIYPFEK
jgi:hypothetical protein